MWKNLNENLWENFPFRWIQQMGKIDMGIIYGKLYNSQTRTFLIRTGEKFIDETGH